MPPAPAILHGVGVIARFVRPEPIFPYPIPIPAKIWRDVGVWRERKGYASQP